MTRRWTAIDDDLLSTAPPPPQTVYSDRKGEEREGWQILWVEMDYRLLKFVGQGIIPLISSDSCSMVWYLLWQFLPHLMNLGFFCTISFHFYPSYNKIVIARPMKNPQVHKAK